MLLDIRLSTLNLFSYLAVGVMAPKCPLTRVNICEGYVLNP